MTPDERGSPTPGEREKLEQEVMDLHRARDEGETRSALRRLPIVIVTMILLGLLLRWLAS